MALVVVSMAAWEVPELMVLAAALVAIKALDYTEVDSKVANSDLNLDLRLDLKVATVWAIEMETVVAVVAPVAPVAPVVTVAVPVAITKEWKVVTNKVDRKNKADRKLDHKVKDQEWDNQDKEVDLVAKVLLKKNR